MLVGQRLLILGSNGLAGREFSRQLKKLGCSTVTIARNDADISLDVCNFGKLISVLNNYLPDIIIFVIFG